MFLCSKNILSNPKIAVNRYNVIEILTKWFGQKRCFFHVFCKFIYTLFCQNSSKLTDLLIFNTFHDIIILSKTEV